MAFSPIDIPVQEILQTDFITDIALISNSNDLLLKDRLEDLINNLEIDTNTLAIGTDNPINYVRVDTLIMQDTGFVFQAGSPISVIGSLTRNGSDESVLTVDIINVNGSIDADAIQANSVAINSTLSVTGASTFSSSVTNSASVRESRENVLAVLTNNLGTAETTVTLTSTTRQNIFLTLEADTTVWLAGAFVGGLSDIKINIDFDASNPPVENTEFTIYIVNIHEQATTTSLIADANLYPLNMSIAAGTNLATANAILLHSDLAGQAKSLGVQAPDLIAFDAAASFIYIRDANTNDRLMIKSIVQMEIY